MGNIFSFLIAYLWVKQRNGAMVLRIDDLDTSRSKQEYITQLFKDLEWFGFEWEGPVVYQSKRTDAYRAALAVLQSKHLRYPCFCKRADLQSARAPHAGEDYVYAGTCSRLSQEECQQKLFYEQASWRVRVPNKWYYVTDLFQGFYSQNLKTACGDFIVQRKDGLAAYQLATVVDDAYQGVTNVIRGIDLLPSVPRQMYLQEQLGLAHMQSYGHVPLLVDKQGVRLSKRNNDASLAYLQNQGFSAPEILGWLSFIAGIIAEPEALCLDTLIKVAKLDALHKKQHIIWRFPKTQTTS